MNNLTLIYPRTRYQSGDPPLGLCYIAGYVKRHTGWNVKIADFTWGDTAVPEADRYGIYRNTLNRHEVWELWNKYPDAIIGGPSGVHCKGEGEVYVARWLDGQQPVVDRLDNLDDYGHPDLSLVGMKRYTKAWHYLDHLSPKLTGYNIVASRGCPWDCAYCQPTLRNLFGAKVRYHSPGWVHDEMVRAKVLYKIDGVFFHDDTFTANKEWCYEVCKAIQPLGMLWGCNIRADTVTPALLQKMHLAGCRNVHIGIEAASDRIRNGCYRKRLNLQTIVQACEAIYKTGISAMGFFMLGAPGETDEEIEDTIRLACSLPLEEATFSICSALPGTHLYTEYHTAGRLDYYGSDASWSLRRKQYEALLRFYLGHHKGYLLKHLASRQGIERLLRKCGRFLG